MFSLFTFTALFWIIGFEYELLTSYAAFILTVVTGVTLSAAQSVEKISR